MNASDRLQKSGIIELLRAYSSSALEACKRLSSEDQQSLLTKIEKQWSRHKPLAQPQQYKTVEIIGIEIKQSP